MLEVGEITLLYFRLERLKEKVVTVLTVMHLLYSYCIIYKL